MARKGRYKEALEETIRIATQLGEEACRYAMENRGYYKPDTRYEPTYNIIDAIGSAVYVDGVLMPETKRYAVDTEMHTKPYLDRGWGGTRQPITGREALERYWEHNRYLTGRRNVIEVVCVAATFYSGILESRRVQVISAAADYFELKSKDPQFSIYKPRLNKVEAGIY